LVLYHGILSSEINLVYKAALRLRFSNPDSSQIIAITGTTIGAGIVSAIIEGALRLVPPDRDPAGEAIRKQKNLVRAERALCAESSFVDKVRTFQDNLMDEMQQKRQLRDAAGDGMTQNIKITPDILFRTPTMIHGILCHWIEYKHTFGFKMDPFVHRKHLKQYRKYATILGSGMVVYSLGFESQLLRIEGVACFREAEVVGWLDSQKS